MDVTPAPRPGETLRVLLLEHEAAEADQCVIVLQRAGYDVASERVRNPRDFQDRVRNHPYDVVLVDDQRPDWTALDALAAVRAAGLDAPVVLFNSTPATERPVELVDAGLDDYVIKGDLVRLPLIVHRVFDERRAHLERVQSRELIHKLSLAIDRSPASVIIADASGVMEYVNHRFEQVTGYTVAEAIGKNLRMLESGETAPAISGRLREVTQSGQVWCGEIVHRRKNGEEYLDAESISPIADESGVVTQVVVTREDITERKRTEAALAVSEARFRNLAEASFDGIHITEGGIVREVNQGFLRMFGYSMDEVIGRPLIDFAAEESVEAVRHRVAQGVEGRFEVVGLRKDGRKLFLEATGKNHDLGDRVERVTALRDVTEKRMLEEQFRQSQKMEAVGRLAGGVAHDFNNLLTVITTYASVLLGDIGESDPRRGDLQQILKASSDAAALTRQLLAFSRQQVIAPRLVLLEEVVRGTEKMLKRLIGEDIELVSTLRGTPSAVLIDPGQLEQVIMNLAVNARDAMPQGGRLSIETSTTEFDETYAHTHWPATPGRFTMLAVSDTGIGMDAETRARVFEPFFTTKELGKGTGLGLATVYGIVKQSGGFIWVYSEPGHGASFKIYLPLADETALPHGPEAEPTKAPRGTETVLLVEDAPAVRTAVRLILEGYGYTVIEAPTPGAALGMVAKWRKPLHLLLTDVVMPGMSGRQLAERFMAERPELRVLYMSGYTDDVAVRHGLLASGLAYLQKPFAPDTLALKVREVLDSAQGTVSASGAGPT